MAEAEAETTLHPQPPRPPRASKQGPLPDLPKTSAPGHWTTAYKRPATPEFHSDVEREGKVLEKILSDAGGGCMLLPSNGFDMVLPGVAIGEADSAYVGPIMVVLKSWSFKS